MNKVTIANTITIGEGKLALIGGPCMAESLEVCMATAEFLTQLCKKLDIQYIFKASYDKANRSSGSSRRGPGLKAGLEILAQDTMLSVAFLRGGSLFAPLFRFL